MVKLMATKFYIDQRAFHWRMLIDICLIILCLFLPMFALLSPSTFIEKKTSHVYSKGHRKQKRGVVWISDQSMYRGAKVLSVE